MRNKNANIVELWNRVCNHDDVKAFEKLFYALNKPLIKFCVLYVRQNEVAEDIVSELFVKCWQNRQKLCGINNPATYLYIAVKNQSLNYIKKYSNIHMVQIEDTDEFALVNTYNPQKELEKKELVFKLDKAISALPQQCRIIFRLIKEDGMKYKEVGEVLDISPRTVQTQLFRALKKLSAVLDPDQKRARHSVSNAPVLFMLAALFACLFFF
ncbi:RNA polymerase sigma-70 factor [Mucilaginibacter gilvus]|uniref:RNA polymerase sigma-70 factor n=1 Tax=Mucilaginibacter gilvus TaxID=2305909 RepID=UPI001FB90F43|nr:RNA polymerase sigma-70 factor [Mucilaginibacter gilvus]